MLLLSSLLGPAKPPVASREDVASTTGVYTIAVREVDGALTAVAADGFSRISLSPNERCLVCLCEYDLGEELRQLNKCSHIFHRECIDVVSHSVSLRSFSTVLLPC